MGLLIAVGEEMFFRLFIANFFISRFGGAAGIITSGMFFAVYHFSAYGTSFNSLLIVAGAGVMLSYVAWRTGRVSTTTIVHVLNNALAIMV